MIELLNLALAGGIAAAAAPVIIHIAHRRKLKPIDWGGGMHGIHDVDVAGCESGVCPVK